MMNREAAMLVTEMVTTMVTTLTRVFAKPSRFDPKMVLEETNAWVSLETALQFSLMLFPPDPAMTARNVSTR